jgi:hypothetical protein
VSERSHDVIADALIYAEAAPIIVAPQHMLQEHDQFGDGQVFGQLHWLLGDIRWFRHRKLPESAGC